MLTRIVDLALHHRGVVVACALLTFLLGLDATRKARLDVFPDFADPQVRVQTEAPGLAAEQVEILVTTPLESALAGAEGLESLRSESIQGLSVITAIFHSGSEIVALRQAMTERLASVAGQLPLGVASPKLEPLTSSTMDVLKIGFVSHTLDPAALRDLAFWTVRQKLLSLPGVARVNVFGGDTREVQIELAPERLLAHGLSLTQLLSAARRSTAITGAGFVETPNQRITLRSEGEALDAASLGDAILDRAPGLASVRLRDVADIREGAKPRFGDALVQGRPGVLLTLSSQYGANTLDVTREIEQALAELAPVFAAQGVTVYPRLHRPASFIESALDNLRFSLVLGGLLVSLVLLPLLGRLRITLISVVAIPLSLLGAVLVLERFGVTLNTMTLGGLAIAIGEVVDDAIIDVENIARRLRENSRLANPRAAHQVILDASIEVRGAVVYATMIVGLAFVPLLTLSGLAGRFFAPMGQAYLLAVSISLVVALVVTPALSLIVLRGPAIEDEEPRLQRWTKRHYERLLESSARHARGILVAVAVLTLAALFVLPQLGGEFLPTFREGHLVLQVSEAPGASIDEMLRVGRAISADLLALPGIATVEQQVGRAEQGEDTWGPHRSEFHVELEPDADQSERHLTDQVRAILASYPGIQFEVLTFLGDRISETLTGEIAPVVVSVFGRDLGAIDRTAEAVARALATVPGASEVKTAVPVGLPTLSIALRPERLAALGFLPVDVLDTVRIAYQGEVVTQLHREGRPIDVVVRLAEARRKSPDRVGSLLVRSSDGTLVPLSELADLRLVAGRESIRHEGERRRQSVTCIPRGRDVLSFSAEAEKVVRATVELPPDTYLEFGGTAEAQIEARRELFFECGAVGVGMVLLLGLAFGEARSVGLILANLPFSLVGGVLAIVLARLMGSDAGQLTMGSLVGFVTLFGITMRNSIMLISHYGHLVEETGLAWGPELARRGAVDRVVPIVMTALVTGLGLLPLAFGSGDAGREIEGPMAVVILGGLASSTALNLLVLPVLAERFGRFSRAVRSPASGTSVSGSR